MLLLIILYSISTITALITLKIARRYRHESEQKRLRALKITTVVVIGLAIMMGLMLSLPGVLHSLGVD